MTAAEARQILALPPDQAVAQILALAHKAEQYDQLVGTVSPTTPSGMTPVYLKAAASPKRKKRPGRKRGHAGVGRRRAVQVDQVQEHTLTHCPHCQTPVQEPIQQYQRTIEDIPPLEKPQVTQHVVRGYWCSGCRKIVYPPVTAALPHAVIGLRLVVFTAWLHYLVGVSVDHIVRLLSVMCSFPISAGGLTHAWKNLALLVEARYDQIGREIAQSAVLHADETGWRLNGRTHWLWCFSNRILCYYLITPGRGSPVIRQVLGELFSGILVCDFWGAYNKISALAKQRCFFHLFTELVKVDKSNRSLAWKAFRKTLTRLLKDAVRLSEKKSHQDPVLVARLRQKLQARLGRLLETDTQDRDVRRLLKRLKRHQNELLTFLDYENVSPYNNHAEQQMRKPVLTRKVSQQNRSELGAKTQAILMTLFRSAELQGENPLETVRSLAESFIQIKPNQDVPLKLAA
jgi:hypothetical protein